MSAVRWCPGKSRCSIPRCSRLRTPTNSGSGRQRAGGVAIELFESVRRVQEATATSGFALRSSASSGLRRCLGSGVGKTVTVEGAYEDRDLGAIHVQRGAGLLRRGGASPVGRRSTQAPPDFPQRTQRPGVGSAACGAQGFFDPALPVSGFTFPFVLQLFVLEWSGAVRTCADT